MYIYVHAEYSNVKYSCNLFMHMYICVHPRILATKDQKQTIQKIDYSK